MKTGDALKATTLAMVNVMKDDVRFSTSPFKAGLDRWYAVINGGGDTTKAEDSILISAWNMYVGLGPTTY